MQKAIGAALLVAGVLLLFFGYSEYQSLQSEVIGILHRLTRRIVRC